MSDADPILAGKHMLVVDDEPLLAYDLTDVLHLHGARVAGTCMSVGEALELIESGERIDGAVLDIQIGDTDVWPCAKALADRAIPFLFVSATCGMRPLPDAFEGRPCLPKPVDLVRLRENLRTLFRS